VWFNSDIRHHINCLCTLRRNITKTPLNTIKTICQNLLQAKMSNAWMNYESDFIASSDTSKIYKNIRGFVKSKSVLSTMITILCHLTVILIRSMHLIIQFSIKIPLILHLPQSRITLSYWYHWSWYLWCIGRPRHI